MKRLRVLLFETIDDPYYNLAFEEAFFLVRARGAIEDETLRIWRNRDAVVLGFFRSVEEDVVLDETRRYDTAIVRRFTGGGTVYHDLGNLNYAVTYTGEGVSRPVDTAYSFLIKGIINALKHLGLVPRIENTNDIIIYDRKVSGTAASYRWNTVFFHGSLLVSSNIERLYKLLRIPKKIPKGISPVKYRVTTLSRILGGGIGFKEVIEYIVRAYEELYGAEAYTDIPSSLEIRVADFLYKNKYLDRKWNLEKTLTYGFTRLYKDVVEIIEESL
ncbi:MAG: lipoate--protein ligase family protein [Desulfurococcales archaeon]|nr:lipoate--protein ligase family protein [Desulfurococcales archaeon]